MSEANALKVAICDCLIKINEGLDPVNRDRWGPIIPPTAIDWIGDALVAAVLASRRENGEDHPILPTPKGCWGSDALPAATRERGNSE